MSLFRYICIMKWYRCVNVGLMVVIVVVVVGTLLGFWQKGTKKKKENWL